MTVADDAPAAAPDFVVVANRLPVDLRTDRRGRPRVRRAPGGLVTALEPVLRGGSGAWVGWPGGVDTAPAPFVDDRLALHPVALSAQEVEEYYEGFANATLWPLFHDLIVTPRYDRRWWHGYRAVNRRFAEETAAVAADGATVWVQDYQLLLVPRMLRELRPDLTIGFFLHIPFPPTELFLQLPWRREIVEGMLGADLIGFQLAGGADNFLALTRRLLGHRTSRAAVRADRPGTVQVDARTACVGAFPISIDTAAVDRSARSAANRRRAAQLRADLGRPGTLLLGVDRLDYTKGIDLRLHALEELIAEDRIDPSRVSLLQLATPSREQVAAYEHQRQVIEQQVSRLNGRYSTLAHPLVHYIHRPVDRQTLTAMFTAADVMLVTPLRDGMNLVAKEYVACRTDLDGALVLSEFAGAAAELTQAYQVNPHDLESIKDAIEAAMTVDAHEARRRMSALRRTVAGADVHRWARSFLGALHAPPAAD